MNPRVPSIAAQGRMLRALLEHPPAGKNPLEIFTASFLPEIEPGAEFRSNYATQAISEFGWLWITGEFRRAIGNGPPGCGKSLIIETMLPCLAWGLFGPRDWWLTVAYEGSLAQEFNSRRARIMSSALYEATFPDTRLGRGLKTEVAARDGGKMHAVSIGEPVIGKHYPWQIFGDLLNPTQVNSKVAGEMQVALRRAWNFVQETVSRQRAYASLSQMVFAQRIHQYDPSGKFAELFPDAAHLCLPFEYAPKAQWIRGGWSARLDKRERKGEQAYPLPENEVSAKRTALGPERFAAQYQQNPQPPGGSLLKREWLSKRWTELPRGIERTGAFVQSWDGAAKGKKESHSRIVGQLWLKYQGDAWLIDETEPVQADFVESRDLIVAAQARPLWGLARTVLIENQAAGIGLAQIFKENPQKYPWGRYVEPYETGSTSYIQRMDPWLPCFRAGQVWIPSRERAAWIDDWENEMCAVPHGLYDDRWDACSQALAHIFGGGALSYKDAAANARAFVQGIRRSFVQGIRR